MEINGKIETRREVTGNISTAALQGVVSVEGSTESSAQDESTVHGRVMTLQNISGNIKATSALSGDLNDDVKNRLLKDYTILLNKPSINGVTLVGNKTSADLGIPVIYFDTTENWNSQSSLIGEKNVIYVYTDYDTDEEGNNVAGIKIGDGSAYLIDAPFLDVNIREHILDTIIHITQDEREFWNGKFRCYMSDDDVETLVFTAD